jgi:hypothetical protein
MNAGQLTWRGTIRNGEISGTGASSQSGHTWTFTLTRAE